MDVIAPLEADTRMAVIAAPAAMVWGALKAINILECGLRSAHGEFALPIANFRFIKIVSL